jgi:hypothetical protein
VVTVADVAEVSELVVLAPPVPRTAERVAAPLAPCRSKVLAALCTELNDTETRYPGTDLTLVYSVKQHLIQT